MLVNADNTLKISIELTKKDMELMLKNRDLYQSKIGSQGEKLLIHIYCSDLEEFDD